MTSSHVFEAEAKYSPSGDVRIVLRGELDVSTAPDLGAVLDEVSSRPLPALTIDVGELTFCDSSGIRQFLRASNLCSSLDAPMTVVGAQNIVRRVFEISGLANLLAPDPA